MPAFSSLSQTATGQNWINQFGISDQPAAAAMLDSMLLLNEEQVVTSIRTALDRVARGPRHHGKRIALYAEREFQEAAMFPSKFEPDRDGKLRLRAFGRNGPAAVKPVRGRSRVGSEGLLAFVASQQKDAWPKIYMNHPGPDRLRGKTAPAGEIVILTDFIGSGKRIRSMLDKFWVVPTVRSWVSRNLIKFRVIAAATTNSGLLKVRSHRLRPQIIHEWIAPTVSWETSSIWLFEWTKLIESYGPPSGRGTGRYGYGDQAALIAFSYRIPNNTPALIHKSQGGWHALYEGPAPPDLHALFGVKDVSQIIDTAAAENGIALTSTLTEDERRMALTLGLLRGRWQSGSETALASRTGLPLPVVMDTLREALKKQLITPEARLTDEGYAFLRQSGSQERGKPIIATHAKPYYPENLRVPR